MFLLGYILQCSTLKRNLWMLYRSSLLTNNHGFCFGTIKLDQPLLGPIFDEPKVITYVGSRVGGIVDSDVQSYIVSIESDFRGYNIDNIINVYEKKKEA